MTPVIHCIRHGQGLHNQAGNYNLPDPRLTQLGEEQCERLRLGSFPDQSNISLVVASPLCRALHTASITFRPALSANGKCMPEVLALPDAQETSDDPCDVGTDPESLRVTAAENSWPADISLVTEGWNDKSLSSRYGPQSSAIAARACSTRLFLRQKIRDLVAKGDADVEIVLITHGGFLHFLTDDWEDSYQYPGTGWHNCETRTYVFEKDFTTDEDAEARLTETMESRCRRGKAYPMLSREKQPELFEIAMQEWERQGLQRPDTVGAS